jgi:hypothetical protein
VHSTPAEPQETRRTEGVTELANMGVVTVRLAGTVKYEELLPVGRGYVTSIGDSF